MGRRFFCTLLLTLGLLAAPAAEASIAVDSSSSCTPTSANSFTWSHTTSGVDRVLIVGVALRNPNSQTVSSVTYAGTSLTQVLARDNGTSVRIEIWRLVGPALGTNNVVVSYASGVSAKTACGAVSLTGVDQSNPIDATNSATGTSLAPSVTVTTVTNYAWVIDGIAFRSTGNAKPTGTAGGGQTERWSGYTEGGGSDPNIRGKGSTEGPKNPAGSVVMDWSLDGSTSVDWAAAGVALKPDACPSTTVAEPTYVAANAQSGQATVYWGGADSLIILRKAGAFTTESPTNGQSYTAGGTIGAATVIYDGTSAASGTTCTSTSCTDTGLTNGTAYHYKVHTKSGTCYANGLTVNGTPPSGTHPAWTYMLAGGSILKAGVTGEGTIYTSSNASRIVSLSTSNGIQSWAPVSTTSAIQGWLVWIPISGGSTKAVIGGDQGGKVYSVDVATGATNWSPTMTGANAVQAPVAAQLRDYSNASFQSTYSTDVIFGASRNSSTTDNKLYAVRASDGTALWTFNQNGTDYAVDYIAGMPYVDYSRNRLYVASRAGAAGTQQSFWAINTLNGSVVGSLALGHLETSPTLSYDGTTIYVANTAGDLYAINASDLTQKWTSPSALGTAVNGFVWEDYSTAGRLYFSTANGNVWCLQDPGAGVAPPDPASPVWKTAVAGPSTPLLLDKLYVGSSNGKVHQINPTTGTNEKQFTVGDGTKTVGDPSTEDGTQVFVGTTEGKIYKLPLPLP
ncbi:MAG: PQQ-binding-like beta-propeller repeat protein [Candidatus Rokubacteria bacterium]|nr:PQQ-binding-like beta-propeller repeat protein [Candidatus Rokubacteria bacterium]